MLTDGRTDGQIKPQSPQLNNDKEKLFFLGILIGFIVTCASLYCIVADGRAGANNPHPLPHTETIATAA